MNIEDVDAALTRIREAAAKGDNEVAHLLEDSLYTAVLREVAKRNTREGLLAKTALRASKIKGFSRWMA